ncbi:MAG: glycosyltransferase family 2 protein [Chloroflexi bacterium]|nr:glycosyltransferase family 2 protein [Chloroflexota bacterium]
MVITARPREPRPRPLLSIVMPVYNERESFALTMDAVLEKAVPGVDKEIIVVESSSRDGTRELVQQYRNHPDVTVLLQERAKGKGNAVREGFKLAQGDFVLIQDADQEYDVEDYDALIRPLQTYQRAFVLGSRHIGGWKIREFNATPGVVQLFNFGHLLFLSMFNVLYGQRLRDPFTMYKVFWRDCLHGLHLECNRFDFDFELVIKLIRKGYRPLEIPVNYRSRSFQEGKKVSVLRDPLTWLRALLRYRFGSIYRADPA